MGGQFKNTILSGIKVLVTRPAHQAQVLCDMITQKGGTVICLPTIAIESIPLSGKTKEQIKKPEQIDLAIFISPNAVEYGLNHLLAQGEIPDKLKLVSIGQASAAKIQQMLGREPDIYPTKQYNSEALLALSSMQADKVKQKKVVIFRGRGGRELLADTLKQRGAIVDYAEVYQRVRPEVESSVLDKILSSDGPDIVSVTSDEGLNNLVAMFSRQFDKNQLEPIWQKPLVVVTDKMCRNAREQGFKNDIMVAEKASNEALLSSIQDWVIQQYNKDKELSNGKKSGQ